MTNEDTSSDESGAVVERPVETPTTVVTTPAEESTAPVVVPTPTPVETPTTVVTDDVVGKAYGASSLIQTVVWSVIALVLLGVALYALHFYLGFF